MLKYHIFADNAKQAQSIINELNKHNFVSYYTIYKKPGEILIKITVPLLDKYVNSCESSCILEDIRLRLGL